MTKAKPDERDDVIRAMATALAEVEWVLMADLAGNVAWKCPWCKSNRGTGHTEECERQLALEAAGEQA